MQKDEVKAFKNELRNYNYYRLRISSLDNSIEFLYDRLGGVRGIDPSKEPLHTVPNKEYEWKIRDDISRLDAQKSLVEAKIKEIDRVLGNMETSIRTAVMDVYVNNKTIMNVARDMYLSHNGLLKRMNRAIKKALED